MKYNKLVRDKIPEILDKKGVPYEVRVAGNEEYKEELIKKLEEEIGEFKEAGSVEELADILEVVDALKNLPEYASVIEVQKVKREEKGGFEKRLIVSGEK
jgi:predicted house-cleaning noncanonical NTP pyrophosphatase (MazG superfamily)